VWIAAHWERRLKKPQINACDIALSAREILQPQVALALRLSGQLLLGLVRIYARKVEYLHQDVIDARLKLQQFGKKAKKSIDDDKVVATAGTITIPDNEGALDTTVLDIPDFESLDDILRLNASHDDSQLAHLDITQIGGTPARALHTAEPNQITLVEHK
jgi:hypothetical protein